MSTPDHTESCLLTDLFGRDLIDQRRTVSIDTHQAFRESLSTPRSYDDIDDDMNVVDPYEVHAPSRKSDAELNRVLSILDNLENGKETTR